MKNSQSLYLEGLKEWSAVHPLMKQPMFRSEHAINLPVKNEVGQEFRSKSCGSVWTKHRDMHRRQRSVELNRPFSLLGKTKETVARLIRSGVRSVIRTSVFSKYGPFVFGSLLKVLLPTHAIFSLRTCW
jgi:hypothetical protein